MHGPLRTFRPSSPRPRRRAGFTLIEVATTVAVLIIVLGLMVSLARQVRKQAGMTLTKDLLRRLDAAMAQYAARNGGKVPAVTPFPPPAGPNTAASPGIAAAPGIPAGPGAAAQTRPADASAAVTAATAAAVGSSPSRDARDLAEDTEPVPDPRALLEAARANNRDFVAALKGEGGPGGGNGMGTMGDMPASMYDEVYLRDAWGSPIVFMPFKHKWVGTAPGGRSFFFSAGPDRDYLSQDDNLYSYEDAGAGR
jgi:type II secretory pathway pseudopilin PulG